MTRDELNAISRVAISRARVRIDDVLTEIKSREMGHVDAETLIEAIRQRMHEELTMLIPLPEGPHGR